MPQVPQRRLVEVATPGGAATFSVREVTPRDLGQCGPAYGELIDRTNRLPQQAARGRFGAESFALVAAYLACLRCVARHESGPPAAIDDLDLDQLAPLVAAFDELHFFSERQTAMAGRVLTAAAERATRLLGALAEKHGSGASENSATSSPAPATETPPSTSRSGDCPTASTSRASGAVAPAPSS